MRKFEIEKQLTEEETNELCHSINEDRNEDYVGWFAQPVTEPLDEILDDFDDFVMCGCELLALRRA